ncbi:MAG: hypothetical protein NTV23_10930 [Propionibacteriales bacterium]|nr:hypothetical protein [Propionibacteriales bacterium]
MTRPGTLRAAWQVLRRSPDRLLVPALVLGTAGTAAHVVVQYLIGQTFSGPGNGRAQLVLVIGLLGLFLVGQLVATGLYRAALDQTDEVPARSPFAGWISAASVAGAALGAVLLTINTIFLLLPAVVVGFLIRYAPLFVLDDGLGPVQAAFASARFVIADLGAEAGFVLRALLVLLAGAALLGLGLFLAVPVVLLAQTQRYRERLPATADRGC